MDIQNNTAPASQPRSSIAKNGIAGAKERRLWQTANDLRPIMLDANGYRDKALFFDVGYGEGKPSMFDQLLPKIQKAFPEAEIMDVRGSKALAIPGVHLRFPISEIGKANGSKLIDSHEI